MLYGLLWLPALTETRFPRVLEAGLWHTTTLDRFEGIRAIGAILPEPNIADAERWHTSQGPDYYPFARTIGGISLFDFQGFDPETYNDKYVMSVWQEFVPFREKEGGAIWLEIDRANVGAEYVNPQALLARWKEGGRLQHTLMPMIEGAYIGRLPVALVRRVLVTSKLQPGEWLEVTDPWT